MKKKRIFCIILVAVLFLVALCIGFQDAIMIRFFPKTILSGALRDAFVQLKERFENDPMILVLKTLDPEGKQTLSLELDTTKDYLGAVHYDMQIQMEPHFFYGEGAVQANQLDLDLEIYADTDFMAVSSNDLVSGQYYGITYDTFSQDIRRIPLLTWLIGDSILDSWNNRVLQIQNTMEKGYYTPYFPVLSAEDLTNLTLFFIAAPADVSKTTLTVNNKQLEVYQISYELDDPQIQEFLRPFMDTENGAPISSAAVFYIHEKNLIAAEIQASSPNTLKKLRMEMGIDILKDPIHAIITTEEGSSVDQKDITIETNSNNPTFRERWEFSSSRLERLLLNYEWNPDSGDMWLQINEGEAIPLNFTGTENGIKLEAANFVPLFRYMQPGKLSNNQETISGTITVSRGNTIDVPPYKNLDHWSLDDLLALLESVGGLLGFEFNK